MTIDRNALHDLHDLVQRALLVGGIRGPDQALGGVDPREHGRARVIE